MPYHYLSSVIDAAAAVICTSSSSLLAGIVGELLFYSSLIGDVDVGLYPFALYVNYRLFILSFS